MRLARGSVAEAEASAASPDALQPTKAPDPGLAFSRVSRAVRLTVMLHARIREGGLGRDGRALAAEAEAALEERRMTGRLRRSMARFIAGIAVEALEREAAKTEQLFEALDERLDREGWDIVSDPSPVRGRTGPAAQRREDGGDRPFRKVC